MKIFGLFIIFMALLLFQGAFAESYENASGLDVNLTPILVSDNGKTFEITPQHVAAYNGKMEDSEPEFCPCCAVMYRVLQTGIEKLWGDDIPGRSDIEVDSRLVSNGALFTAWYVTGSGPEMNAGSPGKVILLAPNGTPLSDFSQESRMKIAKNRVISDYTFTVTNLKTGKSQELTLREDVIPKGFFDLRKKVKVNKNATTEETNKFETQWNAFRNDLIQKPDYQLFNEINQS